jgi:phenylalanyl-tRNA synthetase beta chain
VGRHVGYDRVPERFPPLGRLEAGLDPRIVAERRVGRALVAAGFSEAMTFAFVERAAAERFATEADGLVALANPLSEKFAVLRPSLLPGLLDAVVYNRRRERRDVRLFETGTCFSARGEARRVGFVWTGAAEVEHWSRRGRPVDFFDAKGVVELLGRSFGVAVELEPAEAPFLVPGRAASVWTNGGTATAEAPARLGLVGQLDPRVAAARGFPGSDEIYVGELDLDALARGRAPEEVRVQPLPRHPSVVRDLSIEVDERLPAAAVRRTIRRAAPPTLVDLQEFDRYRGETIAPGRVSLSLRLTFRDAARTLTDAEVDAALDGIVAALAAAHGAVRR